MSSEASFDTGPEWALLERLATLDFAAGPDPELAALYAHPDLSWGELIEQSLRHQMLPMLAWSVQQHDPVAGLHHGVRDHFGASLAANRHRLSKLRAEAVRVAEAFGAAGIVCVATKGIVFESTLYRGIGTRVLKDVDFMVAPADRDRAAQVLAELGYENGDYDWKRDEIVPLDRRLYLEYRLYPDHLPRHVRRLDDPMVRHIYLDVANSLTWYGAPYQIPLEPALAGRRMQAVPGQPGAQLPAFGPDYQFLFTVLHLLREAWIEKWMDFGYDVTLMKFGDVLRLFQQERAVLCAPAFRQLLAETGCERPVAWVLAHLDRTFGSDCLPALGLADCVDEDWLAEVHPVQGAGRRWLGSMRERLQSKDRHRLRVAEQRA